MRTTLITALVLAALAVLSACIPPGLVPHCTVLTPSVVHLEVVNTRGTGVGITKVTYQVQTSGSLVLGTYDWFVRRQIADGKSWSGDAVTPKAWPGAGKCVITGVTES